MEKVLNFVAVNKDGTIISARDNVQTLAVQLPKEEGERLLKTSGLVVIPYYNSTYYNFGGKESLIKFSGYRSSGKFENGVAYFNADSFEFIENKMM